MKKRTAVPLLLALLAGCSHQQVSLLQGMEDARGTAAYLEYCERPITCNEGDSVCARVDGHQGAACLEKANRASASGSPAEVRRLAGLAETAFGKAAQRGDAEEQLTATAGGAEALELRRSFSPTADAAAINTTLEASAGRLAGLSGGAALANYYRAGVVENRVLTRAPSPTQCGDLRAALAMLPETLPEARFSQRLQQRRATLSAALAQPTRRCS